MLRIMTDMKVVDVETTGTEPEKHSIVSIGAVDFNSPERQFYDECRIWSGAEISLEALEVNGFTIKDIVSAKKKTLEKIIKEFVKWSEDDVIGGGNPEFDRNFLKTSAKRYAVYWKPPLVTVDVRSLCYAHQIKKGQEVKTFGQKVDDTLQYVGLPAEPKPHNALMGAKLEAEAFSRIIYGKPMFKEFEKYPLPEYLRL